MGSRVIINRYGSEPYLGTYIYSALLRFLYGPRFFGAGARASIKSTIHAMSCSVSDTPAAIAGVVLRVLWMRTKL